MNLAKIVINIDVEDNKAIWWNQDYMHGVSEQTGTSETLNDSVVTCYLSNQKAQVATLFMEKMGDSVVNGQFFNIKNLLTSCIGIHRAYTQTYNSKEYFYRLDNVKAYNFGRTLHFEATIHECTDAVITNLNNYYNNTINDLDANGDHTHIYKWKESITKGHAGSYINKNDSFQLASLIRSRGIWSLTNGEDISLYISDNPVRISTESIIYLLMFFFGSITRYRPNVFDDLLSDKNRWLMSEFLKTQPRQFLYLVTSRVLGRNIRQSWMTKL